MTVGETKHQVVRRKELGKLMRELIEFRDDCEDSKDKNILRRAITTIERMEERQAYAKGLLKSAIRKL